MLSAFAWRIRVCQYPCTTNYWKVQSIYKWLAGKGKRNDGVDHLEAGAYLHWLRLGETKESMPLLSSGLMMIIGRASHIWHVVDRVLDLVAFQAHDGTVVVAVAVVFDQDGAGLVGLAVGEEAARRFRQEPDEGDDDERGQGLQDHGDPPRPISSLCGPCRSRSRSPLVSGG
jgi:hypothetical protein